MGLYSLAVFYNAKEGNTIQYGTIQYNNTHHRIVHIVPINTHHSRQPSICKITRKNHEHFLYTNKTQKRVEPIVEESILKTTRYTKQ
jgi:hypothetical protein